MAYIGKQPVVGNFVKLDAIVTSATTTFNLLNGGVAYFPQSANNCIVSLNGIIQEPTSSGNVGGYTISGSTIVFTSALTTLDVIDFILVLGDTLSIGTPSDGTVSFAKVTSNLITGATAETSIAGGDSILIYDDSASALRKMTRTNFVSGIGGTNIPSFQVTRSTNQSIPHNTNTKIQFNSEVFDTDSAYDNATNYRFTVPTGKGGKYFVYCFISLGTTGGATRDYALSLTIYKNGSGVFGTYHGMIMAGQENMLISINNVVELSATDYIEIFSNNFDYSSSGALNVLANRAVFGAYKLIE